MKYLTKSLCWIVLLGVFSLSSSQGNAEKLTRDALLSEMSAMMSKPVPTSTIHRFVSGTALSAEDNAAVREAIQAETAVSVPRARRSLLASCFGRCMSHETIDAIEEGLETAGIYVNKGLTKAKEWLGIVSDALPTIEELAQQGLAFTEMAAHMQGNTELAENVKKLAARTDELGDKAKKVLAMSEYAITFSQFIADMVAQIEDEKFQHALWIYLKGLMTSSLGGDRDSSFKFNKSNGTLEFYVNADHATTGPALIIGSTEGFAGTHGRSFTDADADEFSDLEYDSFLTWVDAMKAREELKRDHGVSVFDQQLLASTVTLFRPFTRAVIYGDGAKKGTIELFKKGDRAHTQRLPLFTVRMPYFATYEPAPVLLDGTHDGNAGRPVDVVVDEEE